MRVLIMHHETQFFGGAERMLEYFLVELVGRNCQVAVATVRGSRVAKALPPQVVPLWVEACPAFSPCQVWRQATALKEHSTYFPFDIVHGWAARDWELASLAGRRCRRPAIGTLHDHPNAAFISGKRRRLMRWCARYGMRKIVCVSAAVQRACEAAGYPTGKLAVVHNGLPAVAVSSVQRPPGPVRIGFLGVFLERKGFRDLFQIVDRLSAGSDEPWELHLAGNPQDEAGERLLAELRGRYEMKSWWQRVYWHGWVESTHGFLQTLDLLIVPSNDFDPFPTVLLEAGRAGLPVVAAEAGGVAEIVKDGETGLLFPAGDSTCAARLVRELIEKPVMAKQLGQQAALRFAACFSGARMVSDYLDLYAGLLGKGEGTTRAFERRRAANNLTP